MQTRFNVATKYPISHQLGQYAAYSNLFVCFVWAPLQPNLFPFEGHALIDTNYNVYDDPCRGPLKNIVGMGLSKPYIVPLCPSDYRLFSHANNSKTIRASILILTNSEFWLNFDLDSNFDDQLLFHIAPNGLSLSDK
jgi:hypothetical protein